MRKIVSISVLPLAGLLAVQPVSAQSNADKAPPPSSSLKVREKAFDLLYKDDEPAKPAAVDAKTKPAAPADVKAKPAAVAADVKAKPVAPIVAPAAPVLSNSIPYYISARYLLNSMSWTNNYKLIGADKQPPTEKYNENLNGFSIGGGMRIGDYRYELEFAKNAEFSETVDDISFSLSSYYAMANAVYELSRQKKYTIYIGAGLGFAGLSSKIGMQDIDINEGEGSISLTGGEPEQSATNFAFQLFAGVDVPVNDKFSLDFGYKYVNLGSLDYVRDTKVTPPKEDLPDPKFNNPITSITDGAFFVGMKYNI